MADKAWSTCLDTLKPYVYRIFTPDGSVTGFQINYANKNKFLGIATALHVVRHADNWEEPIKLVHYKSGESRILRKRDRVIYAYPDKDLAFILLNSEKRGSGRDPQKKVIRRTDLSWKTCVALTRPGSLG